MWKMQQRMTRWIPMIATAMAAVLVITTAFFSFSVKVIAAESMLLPVEVIGKDVISVGIPVIAEGEKSPFDFILDPQGLLYDTNAMRYGGGTVEKGSTLLFHNSAGEYDFSRHSDLLTVTNQSTVPITVTISAYVSNLEGVNISGSEDFFGSTERSIYLAVLDDEGNLRPLSANGETSFSWIMEAAPENAFDTYSFGLVGACNPDADWKGISIHPVVTVIWCVEPILPEQEEEVDEDLEKNTDESIDELWENIRNEETYKREPSSEQQTVVDNKFAIDKSESDSEESMTDKVVGDTVENAEENTEKNAMDSTTDHDPLENHDKGKKDEW